MLKNLLNKSHFFIVLCSIVTIIMMAFIVKASKNNSFPIVEYLSFVKPYSYDEKVQIFFEDGSSLQTKVPFSIKTDQNFYVKLDLKKYGLIDNKSISYITTNTDIKAEVDDVIIYHHYSAKIDEKNIGHNKLIIFDLPNEVINPTLTLYYQNNISYKNNFVFKDIKLAKKSNLLISYFLHSSFFSYILLIILFVFIIGVLATRDFGKKNTNIENYFFYMFCTSFSLFWFVVSTCVLSYFIFSKYSLMFYIASHISLIMLLLFMQCALYYRINHEVKIAINIGIFITGANVITQCVLLMLNAYTLHDLSQFTYANILFSAILIAHCISKTKLNKESRIFQTIFTQIPLIIALIIEAILNFYNGFITFNPISKFFLLVFAFFACYEFFSFYISDRDKKAKAEMYQKLAFVDKLTNTNNRLALSEKRSSYEKSASGFFIVLFDINNLKYVNDTYGHQYGDFIIKLFARMANKTIYGKYKFDLFRIGGDEFLMILHAPNSFDLESHLSELANSYGTCKIDNINDDKFGVSYGFSYFEPKNKDNFTSRMHEADKKMYAYKKANR